MKCILPYEILLKIEKYIVDKIDNHKFNCVIMNNVCCSHLYKTKKYYKQLSRFSYIFENKFYSVVFICEECNIKICSGCEKYCIYCYICGKTFCNSHCNKLRKIKSKYVCDIVCLEKHTYMIEPRSHW